jgi:hypothetical protein
VHLFQLRHLVGCQDGLQLGGHIRFEAGNLLFLVIGQVQALVRPGRQHVHPAAGTARTLFTGRRTLAVGGRRTVLGAEEPRRSAKSQRED